MDAKSCTKCLETKPLSEFHFDAANPDGRTYQCKMCRNAKARVSNPLRKEYRKAFTAAKREQGYCVNCLSRKTEEGRRLCLYCDQVGRTANAKNKEERKAKGLCVDCSRAAEPFRRRCQQCLDASNKRCREWERDNPDKVSLLGKTRYARKRTNGGSFSAEEWLRLCEAFGNVCVSCEQQKPLAADHIIPVHHGGLSDISNIQPLCRECNSRKGHRLIVDYRLPWKQIDPLRGKIYNVEV